ncbi:MAG: hypothetical protein QM669_06410 [Siphonobacter sp.]
MIRSFLAACFFLLAVTPFVFAQYDSIPAPTDRPIIIRQQPFEGQRNRDDDIPWRARPFKEKLRYGLNITTPSLSFFGGTSVFGFDVSPMAGYRVTPTTTTGLGATYSYYSGPDGYGGRQKQSLLGGRLFVQQHLSFLNKNSANGSGFFLWGEAEQYQILSYKTSQGSINGYQYDPGFLVGGGFGAPAGERGFQLTLLYHTNYNSNQNTYSSSGSALIIRFGWWFK